MPNADRFDFEDRDDSYSVKETSLGISGVSGITQRGPIGNPGLLITSETDYLRYYGGRMEGNDFPDVCLRHLKKGGQLRINRIVHYTDITDPATLTALKPDGVNFANAAATNLFAVYPLYHGADYNNMVAEVKAASNGKSGWFDLLIYINGDKVNTLETHKNLKIAIDANPATDPNFYYKVNSNSRLIYVDQVQQAASTPTAVPPAIKNFSGGTDGGLVVPADYVGSSESGLGFNAFDAFDDMMQIAVPTIYDTAVNNGGAIYAEGRQDLEFFAHLDPVLDFNAIATARNLVTAATKYTAFFSGGIIFRDPVTQQPKSISEIGDVLSIANYVDANFGPWYSLANFTRGLVGDALGVVVNFGGKGNYNKLNYLAENQVNMMVSNKGKTYLGGNFTGQPEDSKASYLNIVRLLIFIKKSLGPTIEKYLEEPLDIPTFIKLANEVEPFLRGIRDKRGLYNFKWDGDQNVSSIDDVRVNNLADIDLGKYRVELALEPINGIGEIIVGITLNKTGTISMDIISDTTTQF